MNWQAFYQGLRTRETWRYSELHCVLGAFAKLRKATISSVMSVCPSAWNNSAPNGWIFMKFYIWALPVEKIQVSLKSDKNNRHFTWSSMYVCDNVSLKSSYNEKCFRQRCRESQNTFYVQYFFPDSRAVYEIMWRNYAALSGSSVPTFRDNLSVPSSRVKKSKTLGDGTYRLSRNVGTKSPLSAE
jgi:hypothetical protein